MVKYVEYYNNYYVNVVNIVISIVTMCVCVRARMQISFLYILSGNIRVIRRKT